MVHKCVFKLGEQGFEFLSTEKIKHDLVKTKNNPILHNDLFASYFFISLEDCDPTIFPTFQAKRGNLKKASTDLVWSCIASPDGDVCWRIHYKISITLKNNPAAWCGCARIPLKPVVRPIHCKISICLHS